jgi:hypothetical protein
MPSTRVKETRLRASKKFIAERLPDLINHFASGSDIDPARISCVMEKFRATFGRAIFSALPSLTWAVPASNGFGRRLRYLVWDEHDDKLIGSTAIGDPVCNLSVSRQLDQVESLDARQASRQHDGRLCPGRRASLQHAAGRENCPRVSSAAAKSTTTSHAPMATRRDISRRKKMLGCWRSPNFL